ncbi:hypothetical protein DFP73DRAFT_185506 [Morchella snyderi]|nr:hypothetical protein DFP73DRAFT_185506 [Morchella snyderi]
MATRGASAPRHANKKRNTASVPRFLEWFRHTWNSLEESKKWHLPVDTAISDPTAAKFRYVEDVLYHNFKDADKELAVHSWVIDTTDISVEQCFSSGAWKMICEQMPPLPKPDGWFLEAIVRYRERRQFNSPSQLLHHLRTTPPFKLDEVDTLDDDEKHGRMWLDDVMRCWSRLLGSSGDLFTRNHKEHWYTTNIWGPVYDQCMGTIAGSYMKGNRNHSAHLTGKTLPGRTPGSASLSAIFTTGF